VRREAAASALLKSMGVPMKRLVAGMSVLVALVAASATAAAPAEAQRSVSRPLQVVHEAATYNLATGEVDFTLTFNRHPDFRTVDEYGRPADTFQYFIVGDEAASYPENFDAIIRGVEVQAKPRLLPIRDSSPADPDPRSGGWGAIRATVPLGLHGRVLTFSAPLGALSDHSTDGRFTYVLETYAFGSLVDTIVNESVVGP
jgi:hypothetical protein